MSADYVGNKFSQVVTNCITEIPQDIKLEISSDKRVVAKAGTKLYYPNGFEADGVTRKFDTYTLPEDVQSVIYGAGRQVIMTIRKNGGNFEWSATNDFFSGETQPTTNWYVWYDTKNNVINWYDGTNSKTDTCFLPLGLATENPESASGLHDGGAKSIDQVFNGFGYIGSTVFALPGVKGLAPNGRNSDGTLNNTKISIEDVEIKSFDSGTYGNFDLCLNNRGYLDQFSHLTLHLTEDNFLENEGVIFDSRVKVGTFRINSASDNGKIGWLKTQQTFKSVDYNDRTFLSAKSMPSTRYVNLTLGASGTTYTAPANGWFYFLGRWVDAVPYFQMRNKTISSLEPRIQTCGASTTGYWGLYMPVRSGDVIATYYNDAPANVSFAFIYAEGEV